MDIQNRRALRAAADDALAANPGDTRALILVYIAVTALSALVVSGLLMAVDARMDQTSGLADLGLRSILSTIQTILPLIQTIALWGVQLGYRRAGVRMARRQSVRPRTLLEGFSFFGPLVRSMLLRGGLYLVLALGSGYAACFIYLMTPLSRDFYNLVAPIMTDTDALYNALYSDPVFYQQASGSLMPMIPIWLVIFCLVAAPIFYNYRMGDYCLLETRGKGALAALGESARMMRGNRIALLKLDLGYWWFYLAQALLAAVLYGDVLLPMVGVTLPWSGTVSYYVFYIAYLVLEGLLFFFCMNRVETTYATVYDSIRPQSAPGSGGAVLGNIFDLAKDYRED